MEIYFYIIGGFVVVLVAVLVFFLFRKPSLSSLGLKLLLIEIPRDDKQEQKEFLKEINLTEQLFSSLAAIEEPFVFEAAVAHTSEVINFYIAVPERHVDFATRQIQGFYPDAKVTPANDYNIFAPGSRAAGAYLSLKDSYILPIRTYGEAEVDTFEPILSTLTKLNEEGEGASVQVIFQPAKSHTKKFIQKAIEQLKKGEKISKLLKSTMISMKDVQKVLSSKKKDDGSKPPIVDDDAVKALQTKISKPMFSVNVRLFAGAPTKDRAEDILLAMSGAYTQFTAPVRNTLVSIKQKNLKKLLYQFSFREYDFSRALVFNTEELASIFHLPISSTDTPHVKWLEAKESAPPDNLPQEGITLGESIFRGEHRVVRMTRDDRRRHFYIIGQTGTGKSGTMVNMAVQDAQNGEGFCVMDPHGDLVDDILQRIPAERANDVIVFNPADIERPLGLNMLEYDFDKPEQKTFIVNEMQSIFDRLFDKATMGPMFEQYMRNALLILMEDAQNEPATLVEVSRIFTDTAYRERKLARIKNPTTIDFWQKEASKTTGEGSLANMTPYITSKFGGFVSNDYIRPIIGQPKSAFNFRKIMDEGKILLVNLSKGKIGEINGNLLGMVITGRILMAALSRVDEAGEARKDFYFYIDEFQNFTTDSIATILSEARKYRLSLNIAHQFIAQLTDEIREAVFGNVGSIAAFRVGSPDTEALKKQFEPQFSEKDLISIENRNAHLRLLIEGEPANPFNMRTFDYIPGNREVAEKIKELSRLSYGRENSVVEQEVLQRLRA